VSETIETMNDQIVCRPCAELHRCDPQCLRDELEDLKAAIRGMQDFHSPDFNELVYKAICILARQYIRQVEPFCAKKVTQ
jgi:hypothetical protein